MINLSEWNGLLSKWLTVGRVYQCPSRSKDRLSHFCKVCLPYLKDKKVLEIGANAGVFGYCISEVAERYVGVEPGNKIRDKSKGTPKTDYFKQLEITAEERDNMMIFNDTITEYCEHPEDTNAFVACFALYHFENHELRKLEEVIWPKCEVVVIQNRHQERPTKHNKYKFWKDKNIVEYFVSHGFKLVAHKRDNGQNGRQKFAELVFKK